MSRSAVFYEADRANLQEAIEQAIWDFMVDHETDRRSIVRTFEAAFENVEYQIGVSRDA
jgi:uncharacterized protein YqeY